MISPGRNPVENPRPCLDIHRLDTLSAFLTQNGSNFVERLASKAILHTFEVGTNFASGWNGNRVAIARILLSQIEVYRTYNGIG